MFKDIIRENPIFSEAFKKSVVKNIFKQIDESLFMTAVILLRKRVKNMRLSSYIFRCPTDESFADAPWDSSTDTYTFNWFETSSPELVDEYILDTKSLPLVEKYISDQTGRKVKIRLISGRNTVCIVTDKITNEFWHLAISFMSMYFKIFEEQPLTKEESNLMRTLTLKQPANYNKLLAEIISSEDFSRYILKYNLSGITSRMYEKKISSARTAVIDIQNELERILTSYKSCYERFEEASYRLAGIEATYQNDSSGTELEDYLANNKNLLNISVKDNHITFIVKTILIPYLTDTWKEIDIRGAYYRDYPNMDRDEVRLLLNAIFSENRCLKLRMCAYFDMNYSGASVTSIRGYDYISANKQLVDYVPNAHLNRFNCFGQNAPDILRELRDGDVVSAVECCINCAKRININEGMTFRPFVDSIVGWKGKCLIAEDGTEMTPEEAVKYLKGKQNEEAKSCA